MERYINIAFMVLLLIPVAGFLGMQNRFLHRLLKKQTKHEILIKKPTTTQRSTTPKEPVSLRERRKKRHEERKKALYR